MKNNLFFLILESECIEKYIGWFYNDFSLFFTIFYMYTLFSVKSVEVLVYKKGFHSSWYFKEAFFRFSLGTVIIIIIKQLFILYYRNLSI